MNTNNINFLFILVSFKRQVCFNRLSCRRKRLDGRFDDAQMGLYRKSVRTSLPPSYKERNSAENYNK